MERRGRPAFQRLWEQSNETGKSHVFPFCVVYFRLGAKEAGYLETSESRQERPPKACSLQSHRNRRGAASGWREQTLLDNDYSTPPKSTVAHSHRCPQRHRGQSPLLCLPCCNQVPHAFSLWGGRKPHRVSGTTVERPGFHLHQEVMEPLFSHTWGACQRRPGRE